MTFFGKIRCWIVDHKYLVANLLSLIMIVFVVSPSFAQISTGIPPLTSATAARNILCVILNIFFGILMSISIIMALWGAWLYVIAGDDGKKTSEAKMTLLYAIIGVVIAFTAKGFPLLVADIFPGASVQGCSGTAVTSTIHF